MSFKNFCLDYQIKNPDHYRCDFIKEALGDMSFPWEDNSWSCIDYLESVGADYNCIKCFEELYDIYDALSKRERQRKYGGDYKNHSATNGQ